ncbi:MAG: squalene--hopene cyclase [Verrucomicrobia bacterium]|nr:squalene--hopene cyclase [Verrucomicrobiota bacterium]
MSTAEQLQSSINNAREHLLAERNEHGWWEGELSTSALSTATAAIALHTVDPNKYSEPITCGLQWLIDHQNEDGGWGDTTISFSNISTSLLCWSALNLSSKLSITDPSSKAEIWIKNYIGSLDTDAIAEAVSKRYGKDRTFSVPILMACAICGRLGDDSSKAWKKVLPLPFELAAFPRKWFAILQLPVVSYALPALIAIGYARFIHVRPFFPIRILRTLAWKKTSRVLQEIHPESGGYLEATPLTSFVTMALASSGQKQHPVVEKAIPFLLASMRPDGSWPIDTNLATWATTLSVKALASGDNPRPILPEPESEAIRQWLKQQQYLETHAYTNAPPGGWAWTDLTGGVPDADDTAGALLALRVLDSESPNAPESDNSASAAITWLLDLQNRDGGIPTFCRGWGALPFDRSSPDLTAHALRAWITWMHDIPPALRSRVRLGIEHGLNYLDHTQASDGSWIPLWFGNQHLPDENNPTYGTAKVLLALAQFDKSHHPEMISMREKGILWLLENQNPDGGWGGGSQTPSSIEETALAIDALCSNAEHGKDHEKIIRSIETGSQCLISLTKQGTHFPPSPIGFYFAKLWYHEKIYPIVWTVSALNKAQSALS